MADINLHVYLRILLGVWLSYKLLDSEFDDKTYLSDSL